MDTQVLLQEVIHSFDFWGVSGALATEILYAVGTVFL